MAAASSSSSSSREEPELLGDVLALVAGASASEEPFRALAGLVRLVAEAAE